MAASKVYRVTAPLIRLKTMTPDGVQYRDFHEGAFVPENTEDEAIKHHLSRGLIEEVKVPKAAAKEAATPKKEDQKGEADPDKAGLQGEQKAAQVPPAQPLGGRATPPAGAR